MAQRPKLEVEFISSQPNQEAILQFQLTNNGATETVDVENYRITLAYFTDSAADAMETTIQAGYDRDAGIPQGGITFYTPDIYPYESNTHPTYIEEGNKFNIHLTARFQGIQSLPDLPVSGSYIGGCQLRLRRSDYKDYSTVDGNTGTDYIYTDSYSFTDLLTSTYAVVPSIALEYNSIDPSNSTSSNWEIVQSWESETTPSNVVSSLPYDASNGNTWFPTNTDHVWVDCKADTWIDDNNPDTNHGTSDRIELSNGEWDGSGNSIRRGLLYFDLASELPSGVGINDILDSVVYLHTDSSNQDASQYLDLHYLTTSFNDTDENTADWTEYGTEFGNVAATWLTFSNQYNQQDRLNIYRVDLSTLPDPSITGLGVKYRTESGTAGGVTYYSKEYTPVAEDEEPRLIVRYTPQVTPTTGTLESYFVW